jgi:hypothetical protein
MSLTYMCHLFIDECRTGGSIQCDVAGILIRLSAGTFRLLSSFAIDDVLSFCGFVGRHSGSGRWHFPVCLSICIYQSKYHSDILSQAYFRHIWSILRFLQIFRRNMLLSPSE